jgi:hypothetical protein
MASGTRRKLTVLAVVASAMLHGHSARAERGPSTQEERERALRLVQVLETDPLGDEAKRAREWLLAWLIEVPDVSVKLCGSLLGPLLESKKNYSEELVMQMMFSEAAFVIRSPTMAADDLAAYTAGIEGALRAYEAILKSKPKARWPFLDDLLQKRDAGVLRNYVVEAQKACK